MELFWPGALAPGHSSNTILFGVGSLPIAISTKQRMRNCARKIVYHGFNKTAFKRLGSFYHFSVVGTSVKNLRCEYSNMSLRNALVINAPRGQMCTFVNIIYLREEERKKRKMSGEIYSGGLTGGRSARASKNPTFQQPLVSINGKQRKSVTNVVAELAGVHRARARLPHPTKEKTREIYNGGLTGGRRARVSKNRTFQQPLVSRDQLDTFHNKLNSMHIIQSKRAQCKVLINEVVYMYII